MSYFELKEDMLHGTDRIEKCYLIVKAQWLKLKEKSGEGGRRSYTLLDGEILLDAWSSTPWCA